MMRYVDKIKLANPNRVTQFMQVLFNPQSASSYHEKVLLIPKNEYNDVSFIEVSDQYVDIVWNNIIKEDQPCKDFSRFARMMADDEYNDYLDKSSSFIKPIDVRNMTFCGAGAYVRFDRKEFISKLFSKNKLNFHP